MSMPDERVGGRAGTIEWGVGAGATFCKFYISKTVHSNKREKIDLISKIFHDITSYVFLKTPQTYC